MPRKLLLGLLICVVMFTGCAAPTPAGEPPDTTTDSQFTAAPTDTLDLPSPTFTLIPFETELPPTPTLTASPEPTPVTPPAIILFIGDGMGEVQRQAAAWKAFGAQGRLIMDTLPVRGSAQTATASGVITDSGASATSIASGVITNYQAVGVDAGGESVSTILELAKVRGWSVGLVSTTSLAHATPAAFAAHVPDRQQRDEIGRQMMTRGIDVLLGGGEDDFFAVNESGCFPGMGIQPAGVTLVASAITNGTTYICTRDQLLDLDTAAVDRVLGLFAADQMPRPYAPSLVEMTQAALTLLSRDPDGFFLMVEAGQIDWAAHDNDAEWTMQLTLGLDAAVAQALVFMLQRPNTLLIVAADHETGGMLLNLEGNGSSRQDGPFAMPDNAIFWVDWTSGSHTRQNVPVTAQGPYADMLEGEYPLTQIYETMLAYLLSEGVENGE